MFWIHSQTFLFRVLTTVPIVFHFKAIQLGVISPLSDYQWPIDREEGHSN